MMATLKFKLPEEKTDFELANHAGELADVISEIRAYIRRELDGPRVSITKRATLEDVQKLLMDSLNEDGLTRLCP